MKLVKNKNMLLLFVLFAMIILMSIGYASINSVTGDIEGTALADAQEGVFITNIEYVSDVNASVSNSRVNKFLGTVMDSTMKLSDTDVNSSITYKVTVYNKGTEEAIFQKITYANDFYDNNDIIFDITGFTTGEKIGPGESRDIIIKFKYKGTTGPDNNVLNSYLNFVIKAPNRMMANSTLASNSNGYNYLNGKINSTKISTITFKQGKESDITADIKSEFDASVKRDGSIMGYYTDDNNDGMYDLIFMSEEPIYANKDSSNLFYYLTNLTSIDLSNFKTDGVKDMEYMFDNCSGLTSLDLSNFNTSQVTRMNSMFEGCSGLRSLDLSNFNTSQVTDMDFMFEDCYGLTSLDLSNFNTSQVTGMGLMFYKCSGLTSLDVSNFNTSQVTEMSCMFYNCSGLTSLDVSNFNTSQVTDMGLMFDSCSGLTSLDVSNFNTSQVTSMRRMFSSCQGLTSLDVSNFDTSKVTRMDSMFNKCSGLTSLDLSNFNTSQVTDMGLMFSSCNNLTTIYVSEYDSTTRKGWTTENEKSYISIFYDCPNLVGGNGTKFNSVYTDKKYARIDTASTPGYLTKKK